MSTEHFNGLTEAEQERLVIIAEECGEVVQSTCKICGCTDWNPCLSKDVTCSWADVDLCTFCAEQESDDEPLVQIYSEGEANLILRELGT